MRVQSVESPPTASDSDQRISQPVVAKLRGVTVRTIHRWRNNPALKFPESIQVNNRRYFVRSEILNWQPPQGADREANSAA
jgi:predicted DNA-binding transcriptional regulator AlpA